MDEIARAGALVQIVYILGAKKIAPGKLRLKLGQCDVRWIRIGFAALRATRGVEGPDCGRIALPCIGRAHIFNAEAGPEAVLGAEGWHAAFGADARAGENEDAVRRVNGDRAHDKFPASKVQGTVHSRFPASSPARTVGRPHGRR